MDRQGRNLMRLGATLAMGPFLWTCSAFAEGTNASSSIEASPNGDIVYQSGIDGPKIEYDRNGNFVRMTSKYTQPVGFADRRGVHTAYVVAEEKAKAIIVRFIKEEVATSRIVAETENDLSKTESVRSASEQKISENAQRTIIQNATEITQSAAAGTLSGVVIVDQGYDEKAAEVWVVVGISKKSRASAGMLKNINETDNATSSKEPALNSMGAGSLSGVPSEQKHGSPDF